MGQWSPDASEETVLREDRVTSYICPKIGEGGCQVTAFILYTSPP